MELGAALLVKLNGIFLCQIMSASTFVDYAKECVKLTPHVWQTQKCKTERVVNEMRCIKLIGSLKQKHKHNQFKTSFIGVAFVCISESWNWEEQMPKTFSNELELICKMVNSKSSNNFVVADSQNREYQDHD